jgi:phosphoribosylformylglycinamidine synthase I
VVRIGILVFPGSNCERDVRSALRQYTGVESELIWHTRTNIKEYDAFIIPGGFSYGDSLRAGAIAAQSPIIGELKTMAKQNTPVLGICNGFQILVESNLLPGALATNSSLKFVCKPASLVVENNTTPFTKLLKKGETVSIPVAHGQGRYFIDTSSYRKLKRNNQIILRYTDSNINGSLKNVAAVCNEQGNVVGMMPHPERTLGFRAGVDIENSRGRLIFESLCSSLSRK